MPSPHQSLASYVVKNPWPAAIIGFFSLAVGGCIAFVMFCNMHSVDLVAEDYYDQEIRYQGQLDRIERSREIDALATVSFDRATQSIHIVLPRDHAAARAKGEILLYRPSAAMLDRKLSLDLQANGSQDIDARELRPGLWKIRISWNVEGRDYYLDRILEIPS